MRRKKVKVAAPDDTGTMPTPTNPALNDLALPSDDTSSIGVSRARHYKRNVVISFALFVAAIALVKHPGLVDRPVIKLLNSYSNRSPFWNALFHDFDTYFTFSGVILIAVIWFCWFSKGTIENRARIVVATVVSLETGILSRFVQHHVRSHARPYYDPSIHFHPPAMPATPFNTWNSFPSDHAAVFIGLAITIYVIRPRLGMFLAAWLAVVECSRIYTGAHYPSDVLGGAALAGMSVWASQSPLLLAVGRRVVGWERSSPALFYMCGFLFSYQIATLFLDIRLAVSDFLAITH